MNTDTLMPTADTHVSNRIPMREREFLVIPHGHIDRPARVQLATEMDWLPLPESHDAVLFNESLLAALADRDGRWAATCLRLAAKRLSPEEQIIATWMPLVVGAALLERRGKPLQQGSEALGGMNSLIRDMLKSVTPDETTSWIMPAEDVETDRAAAHLAAACLSVHGIDARPWLWGFRPTVGRCLRCGCAPYASRDLTTFSVLPVPGLDHLYSLCFAPQAA